MSVRTVMSRNASLPIRSLHVRAYFRRRERWLDLGKLLQLALTGVKVAKRRLPPRFVLPGKETQRADYQRHAKSHRPAASGQNRSSPQLRDCEVFTDNHCGGRKYRQARPK